jgi:serine/threonine protein kinase
MSLPEKRKHTQDITPDTLDELSSKRLKTRHGTLFSNIVFLTYFQKLYLGQKTLDECAKYILESVAHGGYSYLLILYCAIASFKYEEVVQKPFLVDIFVMLMNTYVHYMIRNGQRNRLTCLFRDEEWDVYITSYKMDSMGNTILFSEMFKIVLVNDGNTIKYVATLRKDIRLHEVESGKISFVPSDDTSHPPIILGGGSYGFAFKIMGVDGRWYVVKVFGKKEDAEHEWSALKLIMGKNPSLQEGIALQTEREGDVKHIIVSEYQGDIVLSKVRDSIYHLNLQQIIWMFLELSKGLKTLHELGILHCDIKPDNIILSCDSKNRHILTMIDFGIAETIGKKTTEPQSHYTLWYRDPRLILNNFLKSFNTLMSTFVEPVELSNVMDWRAFFITFLHSISDPSNDFLGFHSRTEDDYRKYTILTSCVAQLMLKMKPWLGEDKRNINFVGAIYFVLLHEEGPEKFVEIFEKFGIKLTGTAMYHEYLKMFKRLMDNHPMITHVRNVFKHVRCEDQYLDISVPMEKLTDLFVEILRDGADLSLLGCLTMHHIQQWLDRLKGSLHELCVLRKKIFFY